MSRKTKIVLITLIVAVFWTTVAGFISYKTYFRYEWAYDRMMKSPETLDKSREMSKEELFRNLGIIAERERISLSSSDGISEFSIIYNPEYAGSFPQRTIFEDGLPLKGNKLFYNFMGRISAGRHNPVEIRFAMQALLYIRGRNLSDELGDIIGIAGIFCRNTILAFENGFSAKIGMDEFEALYEEYDVGRLPHEKQVEILTYAWIYKTGYREGELDIKYREAPPQTNAQNSNK